MHTHWFRLSIDIDPAGNPIGLSYEVRVKDRIETIKVLPTPAPFADITDVVEELLTDIEGTYGIQMPLPFLGT